MPISLSTNQSQVQSIHILQAVCFKKFFAKFFLNLTACHPTRAVWG
ncbi:hypothetical protein X808_17640 [Mannheimia varigena USDA-ARS-USMARC-1296]|uniref:Uncharacterized protein n=1 Tax=Mannheimia varigena USDA-ARS-USMARC-1296 TaxID=1433287 RepID=W0QBM1_9PAST|nr:hypothetical protein X808_17640 [Mannheimia varigena USDA-ARS-USMARC-1296]